jgi:hypothetical protein
MIAFDPESKVVTTDYGDILPVSRETTTLYTFHGELALYNHVFIEALTDTREATMANSRGQYVFSAFEPAYQGLYDVIIAKSYQQITNINNPSTTDRDEFHLKLQQLMRSGSGQ